MRESNSRSLRVKQQPSHWTNRAGGAGISPHVLIRASVGSPYVRMAGFAPAFSRFQGERITKLSHILLRTPRQIRTDTVQFLRLVPPTNWARGAYDAHQAQQQDRGLHTNLLVLLAHFQDSCP